MLCFSPFFPFLITSCLLRFSLPNFLLITSCQLCFLLFFSLLITSCLICFPPPCAFLITLSFLLCFHSPLSFSITWACSSFLRLALSSHRACSTFLRLLSPHHIVPAPLSSTLLVPHHIVPALLPPAFLYPHNTVPAPHSSAVFFPHIVLAPFSIAFFFPHCVVCLESVPRVASAASPSCLLVVQSIFPGLVPSKPFIRWISATKWKEWDIDLQSTTTGKLVRKYTLTPEPISAVLISLPLERSGILTQVWICPSKFLEFDSLWKTSTNISSQIDKGKDFYRPFSSLLEVTTLVNGLVVTGCLATPHKKKVQILDIHPNTHPNSVISQEYTVIYSCLHTFGRTILCIWPSHPWSYPFQTMASSNNKHAPSLFL